MNNPSNADLLNLAERLETTGAHNDDTVSRRVKTVNAAAKIFRKLAKEPEDTLKPARLLDGRSVTVRARADEDCKLYKPVGTPEIIAAVKEEFGAGISSRNVVLPAPIRELGIFDVKLAFDAAFAMIKVWVVQDEPEPEQEEAQDQNLLPCPHCGSDEPVVKALIPMKYVVRCRECGASGSEVDDMDDAAFAWNRRMTPPFPTAEQKEPPYRYDVCSQDKSEECLVLGPDFEQNVESIGKAYLWVNELNSAYAAGQRSAAAPVHAAPEQPKVETLREAADRFCERIGPSYCDHADMCAIVLRRHFALLNLFNAHVSGDLTGCTARQAQQECDDVDQMLVGSGE